VRTLSVGAVGSSSKKKKPSKVRRASQIKESRGELRLQFWSNVQRDKKIETDNVFCFDERTKKNKK